MQLTPLLGVVAGMVLSLVLVALAVLVALKLRARQPLDKFDKVVPKPTIGSLESVEKNPDIIPLNNGKFSDSQTLQPHSRTCASLKVCLVHAVINAFFGDFLAMEKILWPHQEEPRHHPSQQP